MQDQIFILGIGSICLQLRACKLHASVRLGSWHGTSWITFLVCEYPQMCPLVGFHKLPSTSLQSYKVTEMYFSKWLQQIIFQGGQGTGPAQTLCTYRGEGFTPWENMFPMEKEIKQYVLPFPDMELHTSEFCIRQIALL